MGSIRRVLLSALLICAVTVQVSRAGDLDEQLRIYESKISKIESVEQIDTAVAEITKIAKLQSDATKRHAAESLKQQYLKLYGEINIGVVKSEIGREEICFILNEQPILNGGQPVVDGGKARDIEFKVGAESYKSYLLTYNYYSCRRGRESIITMTFSIGDRKLKHVIKFDVSNYLPMVAVSADVTMEADIREDNEGDNEYVDESAVNEDDADTVSAETSKQAVLGIRIKVPLDLIRCQRLKITSVQFSVPGIVGTFGMNNLVEEFELCESCVLSIQFPDRVELNKDEFDDYSRPSTMQIRGMMDNQVPLNESFDVTVMTDW